VSEEWILTTFPTCNFKGCLVPDVEHGDWVGLQEYGAPLTLVCHGGYSLTEGVSQLVCGGANNSGSTAGTTAERNVTERVASCVAGGFFDKVTNPMFVATSSVILLIVLVFSIGALLCYKNHLQLKKRKACVITDGMCYVNPVCDVPQSNPEPIPNHSFVYIENAGNVNVYSEDRSSKSSESRQESPPDYTASGSTNDYSLYPDPIIQPGKSNAVFGRSKKAGAARSQRLLGDRALKEKLTEAMEGDL